MVPVARGSVFAGDDGMSRELVSGEALKGDGLAHVEPRPDHHSVVEGLRVGALLKFIGCEEREGGVSGGGRRTQRHPGPLSAGRRYRDTGPFVGLSMG